MKIEKEKVKDYGNKLTKREEKIKDLEMSLVDVQKNAKKEIAEKVKSLELQERLMENMRSSKKKLT